jgi:chromosome segregation ATPase
MLDGAANLAAEEHFDLAEKIASLAGGCFDLAGEAKEAKAHGGDVASLVQRLSECERVRDLQRGALQASRKARRDAEQEIASLTARLASANARIAELSDHAEEQGETIAAQAVDVGRLTIERDAALKLAEERAWERNGLRGERDAVVIHRDALKVEVERLVEQLNDLNNQFADAIESAQVVECEPAPRKSIELPIGKCQRCGSPFALAASCPCVAPIGGHDHGPDEAPGDCGACSAGVL